MLTKIDILARVERGEITKEEGVTLCEKLDRFSKKLPVKKVEPPKIEVEIPKIESKIKFKVAERSGWLSVYFESLRRPCTLPASLWKELIENVDNLKKFLDENKEKFTYRRK